MQDLGRVEKSADGRYAIRFTRHFEATTAEVWAALTERDTLEAWLGRMTYEPRPGSELSIDFGKDGVVRGKLLAFVPKRLLEFTWSESGDEADPSVVRFELFVAESGTRLELSHSRQSLAMARDTSAGWHATLELLRGLLAGKLPAWNDVYPPARTLYEGVV
jgi:uncharacterized protein YndB with AHSA1/START domain